LAQVPHHFIASHSIHQTVNAGLFEQYALQKVNEIFTHNNIAVMVGGTGLYANAFCNGIDAIPNIDTAITQNISTQYALYGINWLQQQIKINDPLFFKQGEINNPQRVMRALAVKLGTNQSIINYQLNQPKKRDFNIIKVGIELPRPILINCINTRVNNMMEDGLLQEVKNLMPYQHLNALQTVGYKEIFNFLLAKNSLSNAIEAVKISTRQYAKRQMTWFKKDNTINWCTPNISEVEQCISFRL
jgi:tRNA dimethylallyltransferase